VLRHEFVPAAAWAVPDYPGRRPYPIDRARDEAAWLDAIYSDACIITQLDDDGGDPATGKGRWTSALTAPGAAVRLLELLDPQSGDRVMEVGTGTGWTAGMLAWRCGPASVVTIEVDPGRAAQARVNLAHLDIQPKVIVGDSAEGARAWGPYDGVHATCAVNHIPMAWVQQTRPGGTIVAPYQPGFGIGVGLKLTVADADYAVGRFHGRAGGQMMRAHRYAVAADMADFRHHRDDAETCTTRMDPRTIANASPGARLTISALVPGVRSYLTPAAPQIPGEQTLWLVQTRPDATTDGPGRWSPTSPDGTGITSSSAALAACGMRSATRMAGGWAGGCLSWTGSG
jgi:protein-L-isoaspartate(D-aspartate) O-methyltransferase